MKISKKNYSQITRECVTLIFNLCAMILIMHFAFKNNINTLFQSMDGAYMMEMVRQQFQWGLSPIDGSTSNFFQSLGNIYFPLNTALIPAMVLASWFSNGIINTPLAYTLYAAEIFIIIYITFRYFKFDALPCLLSAWMFIMLAFPVIGNPKIYEILYLTPHISTGLAEVLLLMIAMFSIKRDTPVRSYIACIFIVLILMHILLAYPPFLIQCGIFLSMFGIFCIMNTKPSDRAFVVVCFGIILVALFVLGAGTYFVGLFSYTAAIFFPKDMYLSRSWDNLSIATYIKQSGRYLVILATIGAALEAYKQTGSRRNFAIMMLPYETLYFFAGIIMTSFQLWSGIVAIMIYFEYVLWPLYMIYASVFIILIISRFYPNINSNRILPFIMPVLILIYILSASGDVYKNIIRDYPYPPKNTPIFDVLRNDIALTPNAKFNGRVATFYGQAQEKASWFTTYPPFFELDYILLSFSYYNIPTLFEYNQLIGPIFYKFTKKFLACSQDIQIRNVMCLRKVDPKILGLLGVKYFITDMAIKTTSKLEVQTDNLNAFLYKVDNVNIGQYSPTNPIIINNSDEIIEFIRHDSFDPKKQVIVQREISTKLLPIQQSSMRIQRDGYIHIQANSNGRSLIVLPIEYSNCLELFTDDHDVEILRTDLLLTGIIFNKQLDARIRYFTGPMHNSTCRLLDVKDAHELKIE